MINLQREAGAYCIRPTLVMLTAIPCFIGALENGSIGELIYWRVDY